MNAAAIISLLQVVVANLPGAITTVAQLYALGQKFFVSLNGTAPTAVEIAQLRASIDADVLLALAPLPPAQAGDPDFAA